MMPSISLWKYEGGSIKLCWYKAFIWSWLRVNRIELFLPQGALVPVSFKRVCLSK